MPKFPNMPSFLTRSAPHWKDKPSTNNTTTTHQTPPAPAEMSGGVGTSTSTTSTTTTYASKPNLHTLPPELLLMIAERANTQADLGALASTSRFTYVTLRDSLKDLNIAYHGGCGLTWAINHSDRSLVLDFLHRGVDINAPAMSAAAYESLKASHGGNEAHAELVRIRASGKRETPLYVAVSNENRELVTLLLERGADPGTTASTGYPSALVKAAQLDMRDVVDEIRARMGMRPVTVIGGELWGP